MHIKNFLIIVLLLSGVTSPVYAENENKFTLTTYYPAPYGDYKQLKATGPDASNETIALEAGGSSGMGLVVTDANNVGIGTSVPAAKLDIVGDGSTIIVPRKSTAGDPATGVNGMIYYNSNTNKFRAYENGEWKDLIGGGGNLQCKMGSYSGSDTSLWKTIDVGFKPDFVYITGYAGDGDCSRDRVKTNTMSGSYAKKIYQSGYDNNRIQLTDTGFKVYSVVNCGSQPYFYVALKSNS